MPKNRQFGQFGFFGMRSVFQPKDRPLDVKWNEKHTEVAKMNQKFINKGKNQMFAKNRVLWVLRLPVWQYDTLAMFARDLNSKPTIFLLIENLFVIQNIVT